MEIIGSAHRRDVDDADIIHAWENAIRYVEYEYDGEERLLVIGPDRHGHLLELSPSRSLLRPGSSTLIDSVPAATSI